MTFLNESKQVLALGDVLLSNVLEEARYVVLKLETIVDELSDKTGIKNFNDLLSKKTVDLESRTFLSEMTHNFQLQNDHFVEEFIIHGGSAHLMSLAVILDGALLGYCLKAFYITTIYLNGVEFIKQRPDNVAKLYVLLDKDDFTTKKNTLGIMCSLLRDMEDAYNVINKAAIAHGITKNSSPYASLMDAFYSDDLDLKERVLHFFNWMITKCPDEQHC